MQPDPTVTTAKPDHPWRVFLIFLRLGLTSFGGPVAHIGYFRTEFVIRRAWLGEAAYGDLVALCQFLPGPTSSQIGMGLGLSRAGLAGAGAAWAGFTLPSAGLLVLFALGLAAWGTLVPLGMLHGLKLAVVAVVAQAVWGMGRSLCTGAVWIGIMAISTCVVLLVPDSWGQMAVLAIAALAGIIVFRPGPMAENEPLRTPVGRRLGSLFLGLFLIFLVGLPILASVLPNPVLAMASIFYGAGSLVFGGGHVVLPLLQAALVPTGLVTDSAFLAGYGAAQAVPGPLFTIAAYLGSVMPGTGLPLVNAGICLLAIFLPSFLLVTGALPFWEKLSRNSRIRAALVGVNAAVVGLLLAALYHPVWTSAVVGPADFGLVVLAFVSLQFWKVPAWLVVGLCAGAAWAIHGLFQLLPLQ